MASMRAVSHGSGEMLGGFVNVGRWEREEVCEKTLCAWCDRELHHHKGVMIEQPLRSGDYPAPFPAYVCAQCAEAYLIKGVPARTLLK